MSVFVVSFLPVFTAILILPTGINTSKRRPCNSELISREIPILIIHVSWSLGESSTAQTRKTTPDPVLFAVGLMRLSPAPFPWLSAASSGGSSPSRCYTCWRRAGHRRLQRPWLRTRTRRRSFGRIRCGASGSFIRSAGRVADADLN